MIKKITPAVVAWNEQLSCRQAIASHFSKRWFLRIVVPSF